VAGLIWRNYLSTVFVRTFSSPLDHEAYRFIPSSYLICTMDNAIPLAAQEEMLADKLRYFLLVERLASGHLPFISRPQETVKFIAKTLELVRTRQDTPSLPKIFWWKIKVSRSSQVRSTLQLFHHRNIPLLSCCFLSLQTSSRWYPNTNWRWYVLELNWKHLALFTVLLSTIIKFWLNGHQLDIQDTSILFHFHSQVDPKALSFQIHCVIFN
jgi:hypothetical protein